MKKIIITGAAHGIGKATVKACLEDGFHVIAVDKDKARLQELTDEIGGDNLECRFADLADFETIKSLIPSIYESHDTIHALINNAGIYHGKSVYDYSDSEIDEIWNVNMKALVYLSKDFAVREMLHNAFRCIVNLTSTAGEVGSFDALYGATKAGVIGLTKANAWNFAPHVRVNAISPALIHDTAIYSMIPEHRREEYQRQEILKSPILPAGVADVILFLLSEKSRHITGKVIPVDNGAYPR